MPGSGDSRQGICYHGALESMQVLGRVRAFGAVAEEAVIPPHKNAINHARGRIAHKPPEVGAVFRLAAACPVCVLADYGYIVLVGVFLANIPLALYAKLLLLMAGKSAVNKSPHTITLYSSNIS